MDRLTERIGKTNCIKGCGSNCKYGFEYCKKEDWENCKTIEDVIDKLAEYEDLDEQGLLLRLPCKVGDIFYCITGENVKRIHEMEVLDVNPFGAIYEDDEIIKIYNIYLDGNIGYLHCRFSDIGKTVFLTQAEAEQKLKEMGSD